MSNGDDKRRDSRPNRPRRGRRDSRGPRQQGGDRHYDGQPSYRDRNDQPSRGRNLSSSMRRMFLGQTADISVVLLTDNADPYLEELLASIRNQVCKHEIETLAVDAGSTDRTSIILRSRGIRALHAPQGQPFMAKLLDTAEGEIIVVVTQDTLPLHDSWLSDLVTPLLEEDETRVAYGRIILDASLPAYQRGLANARPHISGKQRLDFTSGQDGAGARFMPPTNLGFSRKALEGSVGANLGLGAVLEQVLAGGGRKSYLPQAAAILKGDLPEGALVPDRGRRGRGRPLACELSGLWRDLFEISTRGDLPQGERGDAYAHAISIRAQRVADRARTSVPFLDTVTTKVVSLLS